jgi:hypothetical protein
MARRAKRIDDGMTGQDETLSARHDLWGDDCPACDIDAVVSVRRNMQEMEWPAIEYAHATACGLVEYKGAVGLDGSPLSYATLFHPNTQAFLSLPVELPVCVSVYQQTKTGPWKWWIPYNIKGEICANKLCDQLLGRFQFTDWHPIREQIEGTSIEGWSMGELNWVRFLYFMRQQKFSSLAYPEYVTDWIKDGKRMPKGRKPLDANL